MAMAGKLLRLGRRQLHTVISRETIKPSSPTPSHLRTYNLSSLDLLAPRMYMPLILFYPNHHDFGDHDDKAQKLKQSLSLSLSRYYPFAGTFPTPATPYIDCNDQGVVFVEAKNDAKMEEFQHMSEHDETLDQLFPDGLVCSNSPDSKSPVAVQLNRFSCGGVGLAVSFSHTVGDGRTMGAFMSHWAGVARYGSPDHEQVQPLNPHLVSFPRSICGQPEEQVVHEKYTDSVTKKFVFSNSRLSELKNNIMVTIKNPTRVEALTALLYKTASTTNSGGFRPSNLFMAVEIRSKFVQKLTQTTMGNFVWIMMIPTREASETSLNAVVAEMKKVKKQIEGGVGSVEESADNFKAMMHDQDVVDVGKRSYWFSSFCGFPYNKVDFGWGKAMGASVALRSGAVNGILLMDTPNGDGIEALVTLDKQDMEIFQNDKEMLSFC